MSRTLTGQLIGGAAKYAWAHRAPLMDKFTSLMTEVRAGKKLQPASARSANALKGTSFKSYLDQTYVKKCGAEVKQIDIVASGTVPGTTLASFLNPYSGISQGLTDSTRIGASLEHHNLKIQFDFFAGALSNSATIVRLIIVKQGKMQGAVVPVGDILEVTTNIRSPGDTDNDAPFTVLKDKTFTLASFASGEKDSFKRINFIYRPKKCSVQRYLQASTTGTVADMIYGNITCYVMYQGATAPTFDYYSRAAWVDV